MRPLSPNPSLRPRLDSSVLFARSIPLLLLLLCSGNDIFVPVRAVADHDYYFALTEHDLGRRDYAVANGNPLKGLITNPEWYHDPNITDKIDSSMDIYYVPVGTVMRDDPRVVGTERAFDWTYVEDRLAASSTRHRHAVLTFAVHYPGSPLSLPGHLEGSDQVPLHWYDEFMGGGFTPDYGSPPLLNALVDFVEALGKKYDGDNRIAFLHLGLLGFWGEWHTFPLTGLVPDESKDKIAAAYRNSFNKTKLQARYPDSQLDGFGYYDGSFAYATLDGDANGGVINKDYYFWPLVQQEGHQSFWRTAPMGGETRPEIQRIIFEESYPRRTYNHQDFAETVRVTHASYMLHADAFIEGGYDGIEYDNALHGHTLLGYNFIVTNVAAYVGANNATSGLINVDVTIEQIGVAPFYYPLFLGFGCPDLERNRRVGGKLEEQLVDNGSSTIVTVRDVPATNRCLDSISLSLHSPMLMQGRKLKFAQGNGTVDVSLPVPTGLPEAFAGPDQQDNDQTDEDIEEPTDPPANPSIVSSNDTRLEFYYLIATSDDGEKRWAALSNGDVIDEAPEFGLSLTVRPSESVSEVWFTFDSTNMKIEYVAPYTLDSNNYLFSTGLKKVIATAYRDGQSVGMASLSFTVAAVPNIIGSRLRTSRSKTLVDGDLPSNLLRPLHVTKSVNYTAHGFNTPYAPSLLELVALDRAATRDFNGC